MITNTQGEGAGEENFYGAVKGLLVTKVSGKIAWRCLSKFWRKG
jgi:hypothetical protein